MQVIKKRNTRNITYFILAAMALVSVTAVQAYRVNAQAPAFALPDTKGKVHTLKQYRGKVVVLEWLNYGCPYVKKHYQSGNMQKLQKKYTAKGIVWLSIVSSAPGKQGYYPAKGMAKMNRKQKNQASAVLLDPSGKVGGLYKAKTTPHMYIIGKNGKLLYNGAIDSIKSTDASDIAKAENYIVAGLDAVLKNQSIAKSKTVPYGCSVKYK